MTQPRLHIDDYVTEKTRDFTGREWVFQEMDMWLAKEDGERFFLLTGEPGIGKSAIAARLTQIRPVAAHHFCIAGRNSTVIPGTMLRSLAAQLGDTLPGFAEALAQTIQSTVQVTIKVGTMTGGQLTGAVIENLTVGSPERDLDLLLRAPLSVVSAPKEPVLVMIDSLDEAVTVKDEVNIITLLTGLGDLPAWVRFFCTTRPDRSRVLRYFDGLQPHVLAAESQMNLDDAKLYITNRLGKETMLARLGQVGVEPQVLRESLMALPIGNFLYVKTLLDDIQEGRQSLDNLADLPKSLDEIYHGFLTRFSSTEWGTRYQPIFGVLAVAQEPVTEERLAEFARVPRGKVRQDLGVVLQYLSVGDDGQGHGTYGLYHESLRDYLLDPDRNIDFTCFPEEEHGKIVDYYLELLTK